MRNRASATASRQRKKEYLQNLERHMTELSSSNGLLHTRYDAALPSFFARRYNPGCRCSVARMTEAEAAREKHNSLVRGISLLSGAVVD